MEHRYIAEKYIGPIPIDYVVNHKNGLKWDNRVENLEIVTQSQNRRHALDTGLARHSDYWANCPDVKHCPVKGCGYRSYELDHCFKHKNRKLVEHAKKGLENA